MTKILLHTKSIHSGGDFRNPNFGEFVGRKGDKHFLPQLSCKGDTSCIEKDFAFATINLRQLEAAAFSAHVVLLGLDGKKYLYYTQPVGA